MATPSPASSTSRFNLATARATRAHVDLGPCSACDVSELVFCGALADDERPRLAAIVTEVRAAPHQMIFYEGDPADFVFNVTEGAAKVYRLMPDGRRQITGFLFRGDFLGLALNTSYAYSAEAVTATRLCRFPRNGLEELLDAFPRLERRLLAMAGNELVAAQDQMLLLGRKTAKERIASFLLHLAERSEARGEKADPLHLPMGRSDIADYLGLTTETVSRTFTDLRREGVLVLDKPDAVTLRARNRLEDIAAGA